MNSLKTRAKGLKKRWIPCLAAITALTLWLAACAPQSLKTNPPLPPLPDYRVLDELESRGLTPLNAPYTWQFLGRVFMYYDAVKAMRE